MKMVTSYELYAKSDCISLAVDFFLGGVTYIKTKHS